MAETPKNPDGMIESGGNSPGSSMDPPVVQPLRKADPSVASDWNEHVHEYFNQDAHPGEAVPMATHEAKE